MADVITEVKQETLQEKIEYPLPFLKAWEAVIVETLSRRLAKTDPKAAELFGYLRSWQSAIEAKRNDSTLVLANSEIAHAIRESASLVIELGGNARKGEIVLILRGDE